MNKTINNYGSVSYRFGMFGENFGTIKNLGLTNININVETENTNSVLVGGIAGWNIENGTIENCYVTGNIKSTGNNGKIYCGGIVGSSFNAGKITKCYNNCNIVTVVSNEVDKCCVGGIAGLYGGVIENSYNKGNITLKYNNEDFKLLLGGIVGNNNGGSIINCYNIGNISGKINDLTIDEVGGLIGTNNTTYDCTIENSYYLDSTATKAIGLGDIVLNENIVRKTKSYMISGSFISELGNSFKKDDNYINNGFPILAWQ